MVPVAGAERLYDAALPYYSRHPNRLALKLYDHTHLVTEQQMRDAVNWMMPFFGNSSASDQPLNLAG
jgi:hypothetical protein